MLIINKINNNVIILRYFLIHSLKTDECPQNTEIFKDARGNEIRREGKPLCCGNSTLS